MTTIAPLEDDASDDIVEIFEMIPRETNPHTTPFSAFRASEPEKREETLNFSIFIDELISTIELAPIVRTFHHCAHIFVMCWMMHSSHQNRWYLCGANSNGIIPIV